MPSAISHPPAEVPALQLQVNLNGIEPPIWRRFWVEETITLGRLHEVLQIVMGWQDYHLHQFITGERFEDRVFFTPPWDDGFGDGEFMARQRDETLVKARNLLPRRPLRPPGGSGGPPRLPGIMPGCSGGAGISIPNASSAGR